jgi:hypothetical protein
MKSMTSGDEVLMVGPKFTDSPKVKSALALPPPMAIAATIPTITNLILLLFNQNIRHLTFCPSGRFFTSIAEAFSGGGLPAVTDCIICSTCYSGRKRRI